MEESCNPITNPALLQAVAQMQKENTRQSREAVLDLIIRSARFLAPVSITPPPGNGEGGTTVLTQATTIQFQLLPNQQGQPFFPAFTSWEELRKLCGPRNQQTLVLTFEDYAGMILRDNRAVGFVIDPFGCCLSFEREMVEHLLQRKQEADAP